MLLFFSSAIPPEPSSTLFPYTTLFRSGLVVGEGEVGPVVAGPVVHPDRAVCVRRHQRLVVGSPGAYHVGGLAQRLVTGGEAEPPEPVGVVGVGDGVLALEIGRAHV